MRTVSGLALPLACLALSYAAARPAPALAEGPAASPARAGSSGARGAAATPARQAPAPLLSLAPVDPATPDEAFCGVLPEDPEPAPLPCKLPGLPCGPVASARIGSGATEPGDDLDGDGRADLIFAGRRTAAGKGAASTVQASYGVIYRAVAAGFVLADYQEFDPRADAAMASVALSQPGRPPLLRDGFDLPLTDEHSLSVARLRRWDGGRFRTLLRFCAHRNAPLVGGGVREGQNRVEFTDVDRDGQPEVVLSGTVPAVVFRFAEGGLALREDAALTERHRLAAPGTKRVAALRAEASRLYAKGEWRRAAALLTQAHTMAPKDVAISLQLGRVHLRIGEAEQAIAVLKPAAAAASPGEQAALYCALAEAHRKDDDDDEERAAWQACLAHDPTPAQRQSAEERLRALTPSPPSPSPPSPSPPSPSLPSPAP